MLSSDRKSGLMAVKTTSSTTSSTNGPNSGRATNRRRSPVDGSRGTWLSGLAVVDDAVIAIGVGASGPPVQDRGTGALRTSPAALSGLTVRSRIRDRTPSAWCFGYLAVMTSR